MVRTENEEADEPRAAAAADALERVTHSSPHEGTASQESCRRAAERPSALWFHTHASILYTQGRAACCPRPTEDSSRCCPSLPVCVDALRCAQRNNSFSGIKSAALFE